jgi:DeoR/GlpR family transcriptional regulator of sugar metabolism
MFAQERHHRIGELVRKHRRLNFRDLLKLAGGSPATLRRDLAEMETAGAIIRVHGGVLDPGYVRLEPSFSERVVRNRPAKRRMAEAAAALVPSGAVVIIDAGSTCLEVGKALLGRKDVRLITHSFALLEAAFRGEAPMVCLGGELRRVSGALTGASALGALEKLRADIAFIGATGLDAEEGCSTTELSEAEMKRKILSRAARNIVVADHSKWKQPSTVQFAGWDDVDDFITDVAPAAGTVRKLRGHGVKIHSS